MASIKTPEQYANRIIRDLVQGLSPEDRRHVHEGFRQVLKRILIEQFTQAIASVPSTSPAGAEKTFRAQERERAMLAKAVEKLQAKVAKAAK